MSDMILVCKLSRNIIYQKFTQNLYQVFFLNAIWISQNQFIHVWRKFISVFQLYFLLCTFLIIQTLQIVCLIYDFYDRSDFIIWQLFGYIFTSVQYNLFSDIYHSQQFEISKLKKYNVTIVDWVLGSRSQQVFIYIS